MDDRSIDRRTALRRAAAVVAGLALPGCAREPSGRASLLSHGSTHLAPVRAAEHRVIRTVAGLRPYRRSGFRVEAERLGEKLVVHNYGHGGAGVTLSWGTGYLALEHALAQPHRRAAVLGAGVAGLTTARLLQDHGFTVTIYARQLPPDTTSNVAGALWSPVSVAASDQSQGPFAATLARASRVSHRYFQGFVGAQYGVRWLPLYLLHADAASGVPWTWTVAPELYNAVRLERGEHPFPQPGVWHAHTMLIEPDTFLRAVLEDFRQAGGTVVVRGFPDRQAVLALEEPVVLNCTGLGARELFGDAELAPVRGQLAFLVPQPEVDYMYIAGGLYMFPRSDGILLGGTHNTGAESTVPDPAVTARLLAGHREIALRMR